MAITSLEQALQKVKPALPLFISNSVGSDNLITIFYDSALGGGASGVVLTSRDQLNQTSSAGLWKQSNAEPGSYNYITRVDMSSSDGSTVYGNSRGHGLLIVDALWGAVLSTGTSLQTINSLQLPPRDNNESTLGEGIIAVFSSGFNIGAAGGNITITYTNSQGVANKTSTGAFPNQANGFVATIFDLESGDTGIRSIQTLQFDTDHISGNLYLWLMRPLVLVSADHGTRSRNGIQNIYPIKIFDNTVFFPIGFRSDSGYRIASTIYLSEG